MRCIVSLSDGLVGYPFPLYKTREFNQTRMCTGPLDPRLRTVRLNAGWPALIAALSFLITTNLSDLNLGALQILAPTAGCPRTAHHSDAFLTVLAKAALPPPVIAVPDEMQQASLRSPVSLEALTLGLAGGGGRGAAPSHQDLAGAIWHAYGRSSLPCMS